MTPHRKHFLWLIPLAAFAIGFMLATAASRAVKSEPVAPPRSFAQLPLEEVALIQLMHRRNFHNSPLYGTGHYGMREMWDTWDRYTRLFFCVSHAEVEASMLEDAGGPTTPDDEIVAHALELYSRVGAYYEDPSNPNTDLISLFRGE